MPPDFFNDADIVANFGRGRFSEVLCYRSKDSPTGFVAVKRFPLAATGEETSRTPRNIQEQLVLTKLSTSSGSRDKPSTYIIQLFAARTRESSLLLIMAAAVGGSLHKHIQRNSDGNRLDAPIARGFAAELVSALLHMRKHHCVHRDIKANNVMLDHHGHAQLVDFGSSKFLEPPASASSITLDVLGNVVVADIDIDRTYPQQRTYTLTGTVHAMAPEMAAGVGHSFPVDWWALGVLLHEMLSGTPPDWSTSGAATSPSPTDTSTASGNTTAGTSSSSGSTSAADRIAQARFALDQARRRGRGGGGARAGEEKCRVGAEEERKEGGEAGEPCEVDTSGCWEWQHTSAPNAACYTNSPLGEAAKELVGALLHVDPAQRLMYAPIEKHLFFKGVNWLEVHRGHSRSPWPDFDQRLGFMDLLDNSVARVGGVDDELTDAQQALFAGF